MLRNPSWALRKEAETCHRNPQAKGERKSCLLEHRQKDKNMLRSCLV